MTKLLMTKIKQIHPASLPVLFLGLLLMAFTDIGFVLVNLHVTFPQLSSQLKIATTVVGWIIVGLGFAMIVWALVATALIMKGIELKYSKPKRKESHDRSDRRVYG